MTKNKKVNIKKDSIPKLKFHKHRFYTKLKNLKASINFDERYSNKSHMFSDQQFEREELQKKLIEINDELRLRV